MNEPLQRRRCPLCGSDVTALARLVMTTTTAVVERLEEPPEGLPEGTTGVDWLTLPCFHPLTGVELWDAMVDAGWGNDVASDLCRPLAQQVAA